MLAAPWSLSERGRGAHAPGCAQTPGKSAVQTDYVWEPKLAGVFKKVKRGGEQNFKIDIRSAFLRERWGTVF